MSLKFGSLFAGIGGIDLGLERAGMDCAFQVERDPYCQKVLAKHWPEVPRWGDICEVNTDELPSIDLLAGGFPCQPHSLAGKRKGADDERDLWGEFARIIRSTQPRWVLAENVRGLLSTDDGRFFGRVLRDLAGLGFDAEWSMLSACAMGAPHTRERVFIVAHAHGLDGEAGMGFFKDWQAAIQRRASKPRSIAWILPPPGPIGVDYGLPRDMDATRCLGNSVVPDVAEYIGRLIVDADAMTRATA